MIEAWTWPTPNGQKLHIALEELALPYRVVPVDIRAGEQFSPEFLAINPNHRIPAIVDPDGPGGAPLTVFESGAILIYLAEKTGQLLPADPAARTTCLQWLMFQMAGVGPMFGQYNHFTVYAPAPIPYAIDRYTRECHRLLGVLEKRFAACDYLAGEYSVADIATFPWVRSVAERLGLGAVPAVQGWMDRVAARPAVRRGLAVLADRLSPAPISPEQRETLFGARQNG